VRSSSVWMLDRSCIELPEMETLERTPFGVLMSERVAPFPSFKVLWACLAALDCGLLPTNLTSENYSSC
jgi:hypothetical protein